ncbi:hypothetical protein QBC47DRAFT_457580 [Echria macrotheca]|uniref:F-box domain-containing protein n=1 Tax=Echria macrotheca TaxID=438768 RepID=A0AAJ0FFN0_9PEZI|nr:hypothetical protein QBC47DRAFT_457580 [Echria macrotheca]
MAATTAEETPPKEAFNFMGLPSEVQKEIFHHCTQGDLICLSLVSKHFRELAAAQLYRNFHIVFPDEDDPAFDSPIDGLAGGLDTFVTSDYDYAQHLRELSLDTLSAGDKAEAAYKPYLYSVSCGKFMNTLLLMTLRKAVSLESFRWNIRVELSRQVYRALHQIKGLSHVHIRLQDGPSLYETPPTLPYDSPQHVTTVSAATFTHSTLFPNPNLPVPGFMIPPGPSLFYIPASSAPPPPIPKPAIRMRPPKKSVDAKEPPTLSGFKRLKSLSVLDIDTLDVVTEIKTCVRNSSMTLTKLELSFSDKLAMQARKPPPDMDPEDSDQDDEFQVVAVQAAGTNYNDDASGPARAFRAQEEKKSQESVLGRIFDLEPYVVKKAPKKSRQREKEVKEEPTTNPEPEFLTALKTLTDIVKDVKLSPDPSTTLQESLASLTVIQDAAKRYMAFTEKKQGDGTEAGSSQASPGPQASATEGTSTGEAIKEESSKEEIPTPGETTKEESSSDNSVGLFSQSAGPRAKEVQKDASPDDIDIEQPLEQLLDEGLDAPAPDPVPSQAEASSSSAATPQTNTVPPASTSPAQEKALSNMAAQAANFKVLAEKLREYESQATTCFAEIKRLQNTDAGSIDHARISKLRDQISRTTRDMDVVHKEMTIVKAEVGDAEQQSVDADGIEAQGQRVSEYLRATRGIALQSLSIHLIPTKASVLSRAIDIRVLTSITLLNVGPQAPIWAQFQKENKESPLPLRKIFTDNVSSVFLTFVSQLEELHEFFILERGAKYKPESFAPKTNTTIDQIRRLVLKKHISTLKRLMIKNMDDLSWDLNEKAVTLICRRGKELQELACSMNIKVTHTFMQNLAGLISLRALHIVQLRNEDTCVWVMRETKRFLIDNLCHNPHLKLEWISIDDDDRVERLIRQSDLPPKKKSTSEKAKGKQKALVVGADNAWMMPQIQQQDQWDAAGASSDSDEDEDGYGGGGSDVKIETVDNIHFYDVWGVRIFEKEVVGGRL